MQNEMATVTPEHTVIVGYHNHAGREVTRVLPTFSTTTERNHAT